MALHDRIGQAGRDGTVVWSRPSPPDTAQRAMSPTPTTGCGLSARPLSVAQPGPLGQRRAGLRCRTRLVRAGPPVREHGLRKLHHGRSRRAIPASGGLMAPLANPTRSSRSSYLVQRRHGPVILLVQDALAPINQRKARHINAPRADPQSRPRGGDACRPRGGGRCPTLSLVLRVFGTL